MHGERRGLDHLTEPHGHRESPVVALVLGLHKVTTRSQPGG